MIQWPLFSADQLVTSPGLCLGSILVDVEGEDFPSIAQEVTRHLVISGQLPPEHTDSMLKVLLKRHKHTNDVTLWDRMKQSALGPGESASHFLSHFDIL